MKKLFKNLAVCALTLTFGLSFIPVFVVSAATQEDSAAYYEDTGIGSAKQITKFTARATSTFMLTSDGVLWGWGNNQDGILATGHYVDPNNPWLDVIFISSESARRLTEELFGPEPLERINAPVPILTDVVSYAISTGDRRGRGQGLALRSDGSLWVWGFRAEQPRFPDWGTVYPSPVHIMDDVYYIASCATLVIKLDGSLWEIIGEPTHIEDDVVAVSRSWNLGSNSQNALIIKADGSLWRVGVYRHYPGGLVACRDRPGRSVTSWDDHHRAVTRRTHIMDNVVYARSVAGGIIMAIKYDSSLWQIGVGGASPVHLMDDVASVTLIDGGWLAIRNDGSLWGMGPLIRLGVGSDSWARTEYPVYIMSNVTAVTSNLGFSLALRTDGRLYSWGSNMSGGLGIGTATVWRRVSGGGFEMPVYELVADNDKRVPVFVLDNVVDIATGEASSFALRTDGSLWAWGSNSFGQLGDSSFANRYSPVMIVGSQP